MPLRLVLMILGPWKYCLCSSRTGTGAVGLLFQGPLSFWLEPLYVYTPSCGEYDNILEELGEREEVVR